MFEPIRGGTRGGQAEFKWSDVSADKDRENYLGHSINAPTGRWQKNKDVHWYNRDQTQQETERQAEIRKVKELEADALAVALGFQPAAKPGMTTTSSASPSASNAANSLEAKEENVEKEERRRRKAERKAEKREKKEKRKQERGLRSAVEGMDDERRRHHRSRSRSPLPHRTRRSRSRTPVMREPRRTEVDYDATEREKERERDRRRWELNTRRDEPRRR